jgi:ribonucleoside-diphosphate reductase alpha chain
MAKEGSTVSGLMDTIATMTSIALQYGVPLKALVDKFSHTRFEPSGFTNSREIPIAKSVTDYVFRFLGNRFLHEPEIADEQEASPEDSGPRAARRGGRGRLGSRSAARTASSTRPTRLAVTTAARS